jgi:hypothetical protein
MLFLSVPVVQRMLQMVQSLRLTLQQRKAPSLQPEEEEGLPRVLGVLRVALVVVEVVVTDLVEELLAKVLVEALQTQAQKVVVVVELELSEATMLATLVALEEQEFPATLLAQQ